MVTKKKTKTDMEIEKNHLVGGFKPSEKYESNWKSSPSRGENKKYVKPPPRPPILYFQRLVLGPNSFV